MDKESSSEKDSDKVVREVIQDQHALKKVRITEIYSPSLKNKL